MGTVEGITLVLNADGDTRAVESVEASAGGGLEGDHHGDLTLIASEALHGLREDTGIEVSGGDSRRNVLTSGIDLNALVGQRFSVGEVEAVGAELASRARSSRASTTNSASCAAWCTEAACGRTSCGAAGSASATP